MSNIIRLVVNNYNEILEANKGNCVNIVQQEDNIKLDVQKFVLANRALSFRVTSISFIH